MHHNNANQHHTGILDFNGLYIIKLEHLKSDDPVMKEALDSLFGNINVN